MVNGRKAAQIIAARVENPDADYERIVELTPKIAYGDTLHDHAINYIPDLNRTCKVHHR